VTLIEAMVCLTIIGLVLFIAIPDFSNWLANQRIRTAAESIQDGMRFARSEAIRRNTEVRFQLTDTSTNWMVCLPASPTVQNCTGGTVLQSHSGIEAVAGIVVGGWTTTGNPYSSPAKGGTPNGTTFNSLGWTPLAGDLMRVDVTNPAVVASSMRWMVVNVTASGSVAMCDPSPLLATTNPMHCN
jgi:type IV fimbrial biogenesis protein FimT